MKQFNPSPKPIVNPENFMSRLTQRLSKVLRVSSETLGLIEANVEYVSRNSTPAQKAIDIMSPPQSTEHFYLRSIGSIQKFLEQTRDQDPSMQAKLIDAYRRTIEVLINGITQQIDTSRDISSTKHQALMNEILNLVKEVNGSKQQGDSGETRMLDVIQKVDNKTKAGDKFKGWGLGIQNAIMAEGKERAAFEANEPCIAQALSTLELAVVIAQKSLPDGNLKTQGKTAEFIEAQRRQRAILLTFDTISHILTSTISNPEVQPGANYEIRKQQEAQKRASELRAVAANSDRMPLLAQGIVKKLYGIDIPIPKKRDFESKI